MHQITIRGIEPEVERKIRRIAKSKRKSINQIVVEIIHNEFLIKKSPASSLKQLAGGWSQEEADAFARSISSCEQIDEELWK